MPVLIDLPEEEGGRAGTPLGDAKITQKGAIATPTNAANFDDLVMTILNFALCTPISITDPLEQFKTSLQQSISPHSQETVSCSSDEELGVLAETLLPPTTSKNGWITELDGALQGTDLDTELTELYKAVSQRDTAQPMLENTHNLIEAIKKKVYNTPNQDGVCLNRLMMNDTEVIRVVITEISTHIKSGRNIASTTPTQPELAKYDDEEKTSRQANVNDVVDTYNRDLARTQVLDTSWMTKSIIISGGQMALLCTWWVYLCFSSQTTVELTFIPTNSSILTNTKTAANEAGGWMALIALYTTTSLAANVSLIMLFVYVDFVTDLTMHNYTEDNACNIIKKISMAILSALVNLGDYQAAQDACNTQIPSARTMNDVAAVTFLLLRTIAVMQSLAGPTPGVIRGRLAKFTSGMKRKLGCDNSAKRADIRVGLSTELDSTAQTCVYTLLDAIRATSAIIYTLAKVPKINCALNKFAGTEIRPLNYALDVVSATPTLVFNLHWTLLVDLRNLKSISDYTLYTLVFTTGSSAIPIAFRTGSAVDTKQIINLFSAVIAGWNMNAGPILALKNRKGSQSSGRSYCDTMKHIALIMISWLDPAGVLHALSGNKHAGLEGLFKVKKDSIYRQLQGMKNAPPNTDIETGPLGHSDTSPFTPVSGGSHF